jgi:uncharacterized membrane protein YeiH
MDIPTFTYSIEILATIAFSATAVLAVSDRDIDLFGAFCLGVVTAIGGGTIRDLILDVPVFWSVNQSYIWISLSTSIVTYIAISFFKRKLIASLFLYLDGFGAALFGMIATRSVWSLGFGLPVAPIMLGVITAVGGGILRDVLAGKQTLLMKRDIYAVPVLLGCTIYYVLLVNFPKYQIGAGLVCILFTFMLRASAIYWDLAAPYRIRHK